MPKKYKYGNKKKRKIKIINDIKIVDYCIKCNCKMPEKSKHHFKCQECWEKDLVDKVSLL